MTDTGRELCASNPKLLYSTICASVHPYLEELHHHILKLFCGLPCVMITKKRVFMKPAIQLVCDPNETLSDMNAIQCQVFLQCTKETCERCGRCARVHVSSLKCAHALLNEVDAAARHREFDRHLAPLPVRFLIRSLCDCRAKTRSFSLLLATTLIEFRQMRASSLQAQLLQQSQNVVRAQCSVQQLRGNPPAHAQSPVGAASLKHRVCAAVTVATCNVNVPWYCLQRRSTL